MRLVAAIVTLVVVPLGVWVAGGKISNDFRLSMALTAVWFVASGLAALAVAWRWRAFALPVLGAYVVAATAVGGYLLYATQVDKVVHERVAAAGTPGAPAANVAVGRGTFRSGEHETTGSAAFVRLGSGRVVLTLTDFATSPGPDLRVYLATGGSKALGDSTDLGALKGNKGDQEYGIPAGLDLRRYCTVVIWCRAFSVAFGTARLERT